MKKPDSPMQPIKPLVMQQWATLILKTLTLLINTLSGRVCAKDGGSDAHVDEYTSIGASAIMHL